MLRVIFIINGMGVLAGFARKPSWPGFWQEFLPLSVFIQPALLASLLLLCALRRAFTARPYREFVLAVFALEIAIGIVVNLHFSFLALSVMLNSFQHPSGRQLRAIRRNGP